MTFICSEYLLTLGGAICIVTRRDVAKRGLMDRQNK